MAIKHVHRLKRHTFKTGNKMYYCTLPDCSYRIAPEFALGKRSVCNICNREFILNEYSIRLAKPRCESCHRRKSITNIIEIPRKENQGIDIIERPSRIDSTSLKEKLFKSIDEIVSEVKDEGDIL